MTEKRFEVHAEGYQDTDDMGYAIAPPVIYYHVGNPEIGFNFDTEREAEMLCEAWNKLVEENEQSKMMIITLRNMIVLEQEDLEKENQDNKAMIDFLDTENNQIMNELKTRTQIQHQLEEENERLKQKIKLISEILTEDIGYVESFRKIEEVLK